MDITDELERSPFDDHEAGPGFGLSPEKSKIIPGRVTKLMANKICTPVVVILLFAEYAFPGLISLPRILTVY